MITVATVDDKTAIMEQAKALTVKLPSDRQKAADLWDAIRAFRKQEEANKESVCRPLKTAWDDAKVPFDTFIKECQGYETRLQGLMSAWDSEQDRLARIEQDRLQAIADKANAKRIEKAEAKGVEPMLKVAPVVQAPPKNIETQAGTTQSRSTKKVYRVKGADQNFLSPGGIALDAANPLVFGLLEKWPSLFVLDKVKFNALAKTGMLDWHPNVEVTEEYVYSQR